MKLSELASEHNLDADLLREVVEVDLSIRLPKGLDTLLKEAEISRILASDGLETADGKPFTPIIPKEFEEKHKKKVATKKGLETKKRKLEAEAEIKRKEDETKVEAERRKHADELARRESERQEREAQEAEQVRMRSESEAMVHVEAQRFAAEEDMKRRESEAKRISTELSAIRQASAVANANATAANANAKEAANAAANAHTAANAIAQIEAPVAPLQPQALATTVDAPSAPTAAPTPAPVELKPSAPAPVVTKAPAPAPVPVVKPPMAEIKAVKGIGSKLASLAKATHEKADHSIKTVPKPAPGTAAAAPAAPSLEGLSPEDRRRLIQDNIRKNLAMAQKVRDAKLQARKKPGFTAIDRSKTPAPAGRGGPGAARGPGGPNRGGPQAGRGPKRDSRDHRANTELDADGNPLKSRRRLLSTEEVDLSGKTEFSVALPCTVREFSEASGIKSSSVIAKLFMAGVMANINSVIEKDAVELLRWNSRRP